MRQGLLVRDRIYKHIQTHIIDTHLITHNGGGLGSPPPRWADRIRGVVEDGIVVECNLDMWCELCSSLVDSDKPGEDDESVGSSVESKDEGLSSDYLGLIWLKNFIVEGHPFN